MNEVLPTKETVKILITSNPYLTGGITRWPTPEQLAKLEIAASLETPTEASKANSLNENVK